MLTLLKKLLDLPGQANSRAEWEGLPYIRYGYYVSYKDGKEIVHRL